MKRTLALAVTIFGLACSRNATETKAEAPRVVESAPAEARTAGPKVTGKGFVVEVTPPAEAAVKTEVAARVTLRPTPGYHVNKEFPTLLKVTPPPGVTCTNAEQRPDAAVKFEEAEGIFEVKCTASEPGEKTFEALFKFAVCTETTCDPKSEKLAWNVAVK